MSRSPDSAATLSFSVRRALSLLEEARALLLRPLAGRSLSERRVELTRGRALALRATTMLAYELGCEAADVPWTLSEIPPERWRHALAEGASGASLASALRASLVGPRGDERRDVK